MTDRRRSPVEPEWIEPEACSLGVRLQILHGAPFFAGLTHAQVESANALFRERGFRPGEAIYYAGDEATTLYLVAVGKVRLLRHTPDGQAVLIDILTPGDYFGHLSGQSGETYPETALAHTSTCALGIDSADFRGLMAQYPSVALSVLDATHERMQAAHAVIQQLSGHTAEQRVAFTLLKLAAKLGEPGDLGLLIQMPLSREDLAGMAGVTTETASRTLSQFTRAGYIRSGRQWIALRDADALREIAGE